MFGIRPQEFDLSCQSELLGSDPDPIIERKILDRARSIPEGFVATYSDLSPEAPRHAGAVMAACDDPAVPWHRVVRADGSLALGERQRKLLKAEGVPFNGSRVDLAVAWFAVETDRELP